MLRSVMVPVDFTSDFPFVVRFAEGLPALGVKRVVLGHAIDAAGMEGPVIAAKMDRVRDQLRGLTPGLAAAGLEAEVRVATGDPASELVAMATEAHVDGVVVGTHGRGTLSKFLAGSVAEDIAMQSPVPTISVRYGLLRTKEHPADLAQGFGRSMIVPIDFSASSLRALDALIGMPAKSVGTVFLLHVLDSLLSSTQRKKAEDGAEFQLRNMAATAAEKGITARPVIRSGDPKRAVLQEANERRATGIVVGNRGRGSIAPVVLGSVSLAILRQASCPVMIVP